MSKSPYRRMRGIPDRELVQVIVELQQVVNQHAIVMRQLNDRLQKLEQPPRGLFDPELAPPITSEQWAAIDAQHAANQEPLYQEPCSQTNVDPPFRCIVCGDTH